MKTTFSRAFYPAAIVLLLALLLVGIALQILVSGYMKKQTYADLKSDADTIANLASAYATSQEMDSADFLLNLSVAASVSDADAVICDRDGRLLLCSDAPLGCSHQGMVISQDYLQRVFSSKYEISAGNIQGLYDEPRYVVSVPIYSGLGETLGIVMVSSPMSASMSFLQEITEIYLVVSLLVVLVSGLIMSYLARKQSNPLREMAKAANDFGHGDLAARVTVDQRCPMEIQELALAFNNMAASLQKSEYRRQEFVTNVSHELKTPMTTIGGYIDGMLDGTIPPERQRHYMQLVSDETKRLSRLVRSMLDISRLQDQGGYSDDKLIRFDICECAGRVLITFEQKINAKDIQVEVDMPEHPVYTRACPDAITQVIYNLVDNGVKFCPEKGTLSLRIREDGSKVYVSVANDGPTIPAEELPLVFERFHKLDKSRSENRDGWGLGLYIVKTIILYHKENISVSSKDNVTTFTFTLPLVN